MNLFVLSVSSATSSDASFLPLLPVLLLFVIKNRAPDERVAVTFA